MTRSTDPADTFARYVLRQQDDGIAAHRVAMALRAEEGKARGTHENDPSVIALVAERLRCRVLFLQPS